MPNPDKGWLDFKFSDLRRLCEAHTREFVDRSARGDNGGTARHRKARCKHRCLRLAHPGNGRCDRCCRRIASARILLPDNKTFGNELFPLCYSCSESELVLFLLFGYVIVDTWQAHEP